jgi:putative oxidoreductase
VLLFLPFSALDKALNRKAALAQAAEGAPRALAPLLILCGIGVEVFMSLGVLTGVADRLAALVLAAYCAATAILWKRFWRTGDFRLRGPSQGREVFWDFLKNLALAGGFLMLTTGGTAGGAARFAAAPFASSHPYAVATPERP